jgi:O-antigen ligase
MSNNKISTLDLLIEKWTLYILLFCFFNVPMLIPYSYYPLSKFYSEFFALFFAILIGVFLIYKSKRIEITHIVIASLLFITVLLLQISLMQIRFPGVSIYAIYQFLSGIILSVGISSYINNSVDKQKDIVIVICQTLGVSVLIQAIYGFMQLTGVAANFPSLILFVDTQSTNIFGNLGQKNDYVDFLAMGLFAYSYLYIAKSINKSIYIIIALFILFIISSTSSRTPFIFFILAYLVLFIYMFIHRRNIEYKSINKKILLLLSSLFFSLLLMELFSPMLFSLFTKDNNVTSGIYRFSSTEIGQSTYRRFYEWYKDIVIFINNPFLGIGWYQYPKEAIDLMLKDERFWYIPANSALYTHSHNSPLNILAETGLLGFVAIVLYGVIYSIYSMFKNFNNYTSLFVTFILLAMIGQSFFQFPLWYAYFLLYFICLLSINKGVISFNNSKLIKNLISVVFFIILYIFGANYQSYNKLLSLTFQPKTIDEYSYNVNGLKQIINNDQLWAFPAIMILDNYLQPGSNETANVMGINEQLKYIDKLANTLPYPGAILKQIVVHKLVGDNMAASYYANLLAHGFPVFKDKFADQLEQMSPAFNDQVKIIRDFHYQDKSIFANKLFKNNKHKEG